MWITERNGKYIYQERYKDPVTGKYKTLSTTRDKMTSRAQKEAQAYLNQKWEETRTGGNLKLSAVNQRYLKALKSEVKEQSYLAAKQRCNKLVELLGDPYVDRLTAGYIKDILAEKYENPRTRNYQITRLKTVLRWAYANDYMEDSKVIEKLSLFADKRKKKITDKYLETDEQKKLIEAVDIEHYRLAILFLLLSGCRIGELIALDMSDVDFDKRIITINKTYVHITRTIGTAKTEAGIREIRMQSELYDVCREIRSWTLKQRLINGVKNNPAFLLTDNGARLKVKPFDAWFGAKCEEVLGRRLTPHALRHTHTSVLAANGVPLDVIARRLGHESSEITKAIYLHVMEKLKQKDFDAIENVKIL